MEPPERDSEIFERIPWESLGDRPDRRWLSWLIAGLMVLVGLGVSIGRTVAGPPVASNPSAAPSTPPSPVTPESTAPPVTAPRAAPPPEAAPPSEADLMAAGTPLVEWEAAVLAEQFVVDFFTRDGPDERSFVEWSAALPPVWTAANTITVEILIRRLAALGDHPYSRVPDERWALSLTTEDGDWEIVAGPVAAASADPVNGSDGPTEAWLDGAGLEWELGVDVQP